MLTGFMQREVDQDFPYSAPFRECKLSLCEVQAGLQPRGGPLTKHRFGKVGAMSPPPKVPNAERRGREHLTPSEIDRLIAAARQLGRHGHRDATMILLAYRHGLRVSELVSLRREQLDLRQGLLHVRAARTGCPAPIRWADQNSEPYARYCATTRNPPMSSSPSASRR